jgi:putative glutamine transport system substrate-binding protein
MMKRFAHSILSTIVMLLVLSGCGAQKVETPAAEVKETVGPAVKAIQQRGKLLAGTKHDVPRFGHKDAQTGKVDGFEIDLVRLIAKEILGDPEAFETQHVTPKNRMDLLNSSQIDLVVGTFTITEERKISADFSPPYYTDGIGLLVKKDASFTHLKEMKGKKIGVLRTATAVTKLEAKAKELGLHAKLTDFGTDGDIQLVGFNGYPEIKSALGNGQIDAMASDVAILAGYLDDQLKILSDKYSEEPYGAATKKGNDDLQTLVTRLIQKLEANGELTKLRAKWGI